MGKRLFAVWLVWLLSAIVYVLIGGRRIHAFYDVWDSAFDLITIWLLWRVGWLNFAPLSGQGEGE